MQTDVGSAGELVEVACDESGSEGENLVGGNTDVFAHASVRLDAEAAKECIQEIRDRIRSPATEYKANHLLRQKHRSVLEWLLGPSGPIHGNAHVYLVDNARFVVGRVVELLVGGATHTAGMDPDQYQPAGAIAGTLYREGRHAVGREQWQSFLKASNDLMRTKNRPGAGTPVDSFFGMVDVLHHADTSGQVDEIMELLRQAKPRAVSFRAHLHDSPTTFPALDPLIPAIVQTIVYWGEAGKPVSIVHDEQRILTQERIAHIKEMFSKPHATLTGYSSRARLAGLKLVDSRSDPRVQVADFLAGVARKIASDELNGRGDAELSALLRPYVDMWSIWGDDRSWTLLGPATSGGVRDDQLGARYRW